MISLLFTEALDRLCVRLNMYLVRSKVTVYKHTPRTQKSHGHTSDILVLEFVLVVVFI